MTPAIDEICVALGREGVVEINNRRVCMYRSPYQDGSRLVDFEGFDIKCRWGEAINELARRQRYRDSA